MGRMLRWKEICGQICGGEKEKAKKKIKGGQRMLRRCTIRRRPGWLVLPPGSFVYTLNGKSKEMTMSPFRKIIIFSE